LKWKPVLLLLSTCWLAGQGLPAHAIVIRHDRPDSLYLELSRGLPPLARVGLAHGTLIAADWVLTAAHVAEGVSPLSGTIEIQEREYPVSRIVLHPTWIGDLGAGLADPEWIDMALIQLAEPIRGIAPVALYEGKDETGKTVIFAGRGRTGDGTSGPDSTDGNLRGATNTVDRADDSWLYFTFDAPPRATELEGISGPGDSGGPALVEVDGSYRIVGVGSRNDHQELGLGLCTYGTVEVYARVSSQIKWLHAVMDSETGPGTLVELEAHGWPETPVGQTARDFFEVYNSGSEKALLEFERAHRSAEQIRISSVEGHAHVWITRRESWGNLDPVKIVELSSNKLFVLVESRKYWRSFYFEVEGREPYGLRTISVSREDTVHGRPLPPPTSHQEVD
jgi:hypothetical protein